MTPRTPKEADGQAGWRLPLRLAPGDLLLAGLILLHVIPIWAIPYIPTQDGPSQVGNAWLLLQYDRPDLPILREFYAFDPRPSPTWFGPLSLAAFMTFLPPLAAEKAILTLYVILFPLAARFLLVSIRPGSCLAAALLPPFALNVFFHYGFHNFIFGLVVLFVLVGVWIRWRTETGLGRGVILASLASLLYFCHVFALASACLWIGLLAVWFSLQGSRQPGAARGAFVSSLLRQSGSAAWILLPAAALAALFVRSSPDRRVVGAMAARFVWALLTDVEPLSYSTDPRTMWPARALVLTLLAAVVWFLTRRIRSRRAAPWDGLLVVAAFMWGLLFVLPQRLLGGGQTVQRGSLLLFLAVAFWVAAEALGRREERWVAAAGAALTIWVVGLNTASWARISPYVGEYLSVVDAVEANRTLLPLTYSHAGVDPETRWMISNLRTFLHMSGYVAALGGLVDLDNFQANTAYFPFRYRAHLSPVDHLESQRGGLEAEPPCVDLAGYEERTGARVDYVLVFNSQLMKSRDPCTRAVLHRLETAYDMVLASEPRRLVHLFRRRSGLTGPGAEAGRPQERGVDPSQR